MSQLGDSIESDRGGRALDFVRDAQESPQFLISLVTLERHQRGGETLQRQLRFIDEHRQVLLWYLLVITDVAQRVLIGNERTRGQRRGRSLRGRRRRGVGQRSFGFRLRSHLLLGASLLQNATNRLQYGFTVHWIATRFLEQADHRDKLIHTHEDQVGHIAGDDELTMAGRIEHVLNLVGQLIDVAQPQHPRQPLETVGGSKHLIHQRFVAVLIMVVRQRLDPFVELQQIPVELGQQLIRLVEKIAEQFIQQSALASIGGVAHGHFRSLHGAAIQPRLKARVVPDEIGNSFRWPRHQQPTGDNRRPDVVQCDTLRLGCEVDQHVLEKH